MKRRKGDGAVMRELRRELHYWQMRVRLDWRAWVGSVAKVKEIAGRMREVRRLERERRRDE